MKVCPYCHHEYPEGNWNCPFCHKYVPTNLVGTGHATQGDFSKLEEDKQVSIEDQDIIRDDNTRIGTVCKGNGVYLIRIKQISCLQCLLI